MSHMANKPVRPSGVVPRMVVDEEIDAMSLRIQQATVQTKLVQSDRIVHKVNLNDVPYAYIVILTLTEEMIARIQASRKQGCASPCPPSTFLRAQLPALINDALSFRALDREAVSSGVYRSPLLSALTRADVMMRRFTTAANETSGKRTRGTSVFSHSVGTAVLVDVSFGEVHSVTWGGIHPAHVTTPLGNAVEPDVHVSFPSYGQSIRCATYSTLVGRHNIIAGSAGLWQHMHPVKAGLHAAAFASAADLSSEEVTHNSATAVVRAALRSIVSQCAASPSARINCLNSLDKLDRLEPGSKREEMGKRLVPRRRGDVHSDLTVAVATLQLRPILIPPVLSDSPRHSISSSSLSSHSEYCYEINPDVDERTQHYTSSRRHSRSLSEVDDFSDHDEEEENVARADPKSDTVSLTIGEGNPSTKLLGTRSHTWSLQSSSRESESSSSRSVACTAQIPGKVHVVHPAKLGQYLAREETASLEMLSLNSSGHTPSTESLPIRSSASMDAQRRWALLRRYLMVRAFEREMRRVLWGKVIASAQAAAA